MIYDVAIVGAGLAGTYLASLLSKAGIRTCIIERNKDVETSFCGEMTGIKILNELGINLKDEMIQNRFKKIKLLCTDSKFELSIPQKKIHLA